MQLKDIGDWLAANVPKAGQVAANVLMGNIPGAAGTLLSWLSGGFGTKNDPSSVMAALQGSPDAVVKVQQILAEKEERLEELHAQVTIAQVNADAGQVAAVNATMQEEAKNKRGDWREFWGYASGVAFVITVVGVLGLLAEAIIGGHPEMVGQVPLVITAMTGLFAISGAVLGVNAWHGGKADVETAKQGAS